MKLLILVIQSLYQQYKYDVNTNLELEAYDESGYSKHCHFFHHTQFPTYFPRCYGYIQQIQYDSY